jgi:DNA-binding CsgD family transcriptional regulator
LDGSRVALLVTRRSVQDVGLPPAVAQLDRERVSVLEIGALPAPHLARIVERQVGLRLNRAQSVRLRDLSRGNPLVAIELARSVATSRGQNDLWQQVIEQPVVADLARHRLSGADPELLYALAAVAALAEPTLDVLAKLLGSETAANAVVEASKQARLVHLENGDRLRFDHPLLAAAAYASLPASERSALHQRLGGLMINPEARARHLALAYERPDEPTAALIALGAQEASARGAQDAAADLTLAALRLTDPAESDLIVQRSLMAASHLVRSGQGARARELCAPLVARLEPGPARAPLLRVMAESLLAEDSFPAAIELLDQCLTEVGDDPAQRVTIDLQLAYAKVNRFEVAAAAAHARRALADARVLGAPTLIGSALAADAMMRFFNGEGVDRAAAEDALALEDPTVPMPALFRPRLLVALLLFATGGHVRALELLRGVVADARTLGDEASLVPALMYMSWCAEMVGAIGEARRLAAEARAVADAMEHDVALAYALSATSRVALMRGDLETARADGLRAFDAFERAEWLAGSIWPASVLGAAAWANGEAEEALKWLLPAEERQRGEGLIDPGLASYGDLLEAMAAARSRDEVLACIERLETLAIKLGGATTLAQIERGRALVLATDGRLVDAIAATDTALSYLERIDPLPFERARTLLVRGRIERRAKRRAAARSSLEEAHTIFNGLGASIWTERTEAELARLRGRGPADLSETETAVALFAADGLTNRQIADAAFLTPKSVEGVLARVYAKLGIRSRAELGRWAARRLPPTS